MIHVEFNYSAIFRGEAYGAISRAVQELPEDKKVLFSLLRDDGEAGFPFPLVSLAFAQNEFRMTRL
jgi:hypothetical protein